MVKRKVSRWRVSMCPSVWLIKGVLSICSSIATKLGYIEHQNKLGINYTFYFGQHFGLYINQNMIYMIYTIR